MLEKGKVLTCVNNSIVYSSTIFSKAGFHNVVMQVSLIVSANIHHVQREYYTITSSVALLWIWKE